MNTQGKGHFVLLSYNNGQVDESPKLGLFDSLNESERLSKTTKAVVKIDTLMDKNETWIIKGDPDDLRLFEDTLNERFPGWNMAKEEDRCQKTDT